jgi:DNA-binding winged helix-turn-helix (wHTH) protein
MPVYRFGPFEVNTRTHELYRNGTRIRLRGQPFQILELLLLRRGDVVTREEMHKELWAADTFVDFEHGLNASIRKLRLALFDSALKPLYIETLPGVGYRFVAPVDIVSDPTTTTNGASQIHVVDESDVDGSPELEPEETMELVAALAPRPVVGKWVLAFAAVALISIALFFVAKPGRGQRETGTVKASASSSSMNAPGDTSVKHVPADEPEPAMQSGNPQHVGYASPSRSAAIEGKVWVVSAAESAHVMFPPPRATPDLTFRTEGIAYIGTAPDNCYTVETFVARCGMKGYDLEFSGVSNPNLGGAAAKPTTEMSGSWGIIIEFTGPVTLMSGQQISILHDDGVALRIDGIPVSGFNPYTTPPTLESTRFAGMSGVHSFDLLYANATQGGPGGGAWLLFFPALF